jgi:putrescine transport system substrate-binding protein
MYSKRLMSIGIFHKVDKSKLKNIGLIDPKLMEMLGVFDPGNEMMIPYSYGSTGITYNEDMILERFPDAPIGSGAMLFDPEVISKFADCGISVLDSPTDVIPTALAYLGYRDDSLDPKELREVEDLLLEVRPYIKKFTSSTMLNDLPNGDLCMAQSWAGDYATAKMRSEEAGKKINLKYFVPSEGSLLWLDIMVIPNDAPNLENAYLLMDYLMRPEISADFVNLTHYASPIPSADKFLKDGVREDTAIYPTPEIMSLLTLTPVDPPKYNRIKTRIFTRFKTNQKRE